MKRFWDKVKKTDGCWEWTAGKQNGGYGQFSLRGKNTLAHRFSFEMHNGQIPDHHCVMHTCDNPGCVRPQHLVLGTQADNIKDRDSKGRVARLIGESNNNAKLTAQDIISIRRSTKPGREIAIMYGVSPAAISLIKSGKRWAHV